MSNFDPTGILSATTAGVRLVGAVLDVKRKVDDNRRTSSGAPGIPSFARGPDENDVTGASTSAPAPATAAQIQSLALQRVDPERETRAYETVNFVLRTIGSRILEANMVNMEALATALIAATSHIEVKLFSGETNRLFQSLARKLNDVNLVNSVFTSIYLVGFLTAELTSSLPNYKREYPALGPLMVQQMMRVAIGDDAFRENQTANLNAYQTVATTAGLLKPTDIGYSIFPEFPSFSPTKYSSKSILDRSSHKSVIEKLVKHFETSGFPQPLQGRDVGPIRDWRFLSSDSNSRAFEVDKADKQIGSQFGRVLYWLICSAHRMPSGMAVVAYYDQHIALIRYLGPRFGYRVLNTGGDLNMSGPHLQLNKKLRATFDTWVVIMPSESLIAERHKATQQAAQQAARPPGFQPATIPMATGPVPQQIHMAGPSGVQPAPQQQPMVTLPGVGPGPTQTYKVTPQGVGPPAGPRATSSQFVEGTPQSPGSGTGRLSISSEISSQDNKLMNNGNTLAMKPAANVHNDQQSESSGNSVKLNQLNSLESFYTSVFQERCNRFISNPPTSIENLKEEYERLTGDIQSALLSKTESFDTSGDEAAGMKKKRLLEDIKGSLVKIDAVYREALAASSPPSRPSSVASVPSVKPSPSGNQPLFGSIDGPSELAGSSVSNVTPLQTNPLAQELPANVGSPVELASTAVYPTMTQMSSPVSASPVNVSAPPSFSPTSAPAQAPTQVQAPAASTLTSRPSVVRRKAPPPPKKVILARALYDFDPENDEGGEELTFFEGDILEIVEKNQKLEDDGWCRARIKGQKKIGLAPLDYLEELPNQPSGPPRPSRVSSASTTTTIPEQFETQPDLSVSKPDIPVETKVSSTDQKLPATPNTASPTIQQPSKPKVDQKPYLATMESISETDPASASDQPPPSYDATMSQSSAPATFSPTPQKLSTGSVSLEPPSPLAKPPSQPVSPIDQAAKPPGTPIQSLNQPNYHTPQSPDPSVKPPSQPVSPIDQTAKPPGKPTQSLNQQNYHTPQPPNAAPGKPQPQQIGGQYQSPNAQNFQPQPISMMPQNPYAGAPYARPVMYPGSMSQPPYGAGFGGNLNAYVGMAEAASGFAQAGSNIFAATHGNSNNNQPEHHHESQNNNTEHGSSQPNGTTYNVNNYNQTANSTLNDNITNQVTSTDNINIDSGNSYNNDTNISNNNNTVSGNSNTDNGQSTLNSYSQNSQGPSYDGFNSATPTYYPPESSATSAPSLENGYDYSAPYFPPETAATSNPNSAGVSSSQDPAYGTTISASGAGATPSSGPTTDPNAYTTAPSTETTQYLPDMSSSTGFSSSNLPAPSSTGFDYSFSTSGQDNSGAAGATSPFASLTTSPVPDPNQYSASPDFSAGATSPFASLATSPAPDFNQYSASPDFSAGTSVSPFASLATPVFPDSYTVTSATYTQVDSPPAVSPFASLVTPSSGVDVSSDYVTAGATSPFASLALTETSTGSGGYFDASSTITVTADVTSNATSPLAGLASSTNAEMTSTTTTTTTTDTQYGYGNMYSDSTNIDTSTLTTVDYSNNAGGTWSSTDYTSTDSTSYDYSESFDF